MEEFSKFSIPELNTGIFIINEFLDKNSQDPSLINLRDLMKEEIEKRTRVDPTIKGLESLKAKYLGKYVGYKSDIYLKYFKIDEFEYIEEMNVIYAKSKLVITYFDDKFITIQYTTEPFCICNLNPSNIDMRDFFDVSEAEFKGKLNKIITNGLA